MPDPVELDGADRRSRRVLERLFGHDDTWLFRVQLPSGREIGNPGRPEFTLVLRDPGALRAALLPPTERTAGEAYVHGLVEVEGDLEAAVRRIREDVLDRSPSPLRSAKLLGDLLTLPRPDLPGRHTSEGEGIAVRDPYDLGHDFYDLWLDPWMQYSCAYFPTGQESLERAQEAKLDLICRKLGLARGDDLLDLGCGWGGLVRYACLEHGVRATGVTPSAEQADRARRDVAEAGLEDRCRILVRDHGELPDDRIYDRAVSVGTVELVGRSRMEEYYRAVHDVLRPGGLFLNVGVVDPGPPPGPAARLREGLGLRRRSFAQAYVFPEEEMVAPAERVEPAEAAGFELRSADNFREHYAETHRRWVRRLEERWDEAVELVGEPTARIWRLYMAGSAHAFESGRLGLLHELYARTDETGAAEVPLRRPDLPTP
jgi:cyclopropane-fatty-acyl-phospholipid synthase